MFFKITRTFLEKLCFKATRGRGTYFMAAAISSKDIVPFFLLKMFFRTLLFNCAEEVARKCSVKKVVLKTSENSKENTCAGVSVLNKVAHLEPVTLY